MEIDARPRSRPGQPPYGWWLSAAVAACALVLAWYAVRYSFDTPTPGFAGLYGAARLLFLGKIGPYIYDDVWFAEYIRILTIGATRDVFGPYPPTMAFMALPVALVGHLEARSVWLIASIVSLALACSVLVRSTNLSLSIATAVAAVVMLNPAVFASLRSAQGSLLLFGIWTAGALCLMRQRDVLGGVFFGGALVLQGIGLPLLILLAARRRWRALAGAGGLMALVAAMMPLAAHAGLWSGYVETLRRFAGRDIISLLLVAGAILVTLAAARTARIALWLAAGICLSVLAVPFADESILALLGIALLLLVSGENADGPLSTGPHLWALAIFGVLFLVPIAYPRQYAAWLLWALSVAAMRYDAAAVPPADGRFKTAG